VEKDEEARVTLFKKQLEMFTKCIIQVTEIVKKDDYRGGIKAGGIIKAMEELKPVMEKVQL
jgi:hypothetical protein